MKENGPLKFKSCPVCNMYSLYHVIQGNNYKTLREFSTNLEADNHYYDNFETDVEIRNIYKCRSCSYLETVSKRIFTDKKPYRY